MRPALALSLAAMLSLTAGVCPAPAVQTSACTPQAERALRAWARVGFSGSIAVATRGRVACTAAYGTADRSTGRRITPGTVFALGSITKAVTAAAILELVTEARLALTDRAGTIVTGLHGPAADVTVGQLLHHTSGLVGEHGSDHVPLSRDGAIAAISGLPVAFPPGTGYAYSNAGYTLLALIVEQVSGTTYRRYVASHLLRLPGGARAGGFWDGAPAARGPRAIGYLDDGSTGERGDFRGPYWAIEGNGGVAMTMPRLARWASALFTGRLVSRRVARAIARPGPRPAPRERETPGWLRYDPAVFGQPVFASAGGGGDVGHNAVVAWLPRSRTAVAVVSNTPRVTAEELLKTIGPALATGGPLPVPKEPAAPVRRPRRYAGTYRLPTGGRFVVTARGGGLEVAAVGAAAIAALFPTQPGYSDAQVAAQEAGVRALLAGGGPDGLKELAALQAAFGAITSVHVDGSLVAGGDLRTYVTVRSASGSRLLWYVLNAQGAVAAAQAPAKAPTLRLVGGAAGTLRPDDPTGQVVQPAVTFAGAAMLVRSRGVTVRATRAR
jgi:CubicO group peptidase (beta-lactamase class C family)